MQDFDYYLEKTGEIGFVEEISHSIIFVSGLPGAHPNEVVLFESGALGQIVSLVKERVEVLLLTGAEVRVGGKATRTGDQLTVNVSNDLLGRLIDPLGNPHGSASKIKEGESRVVDMHPPDLSYRQDVDSRLETGVSIVDLVVPLSRGQRELVIGDRKTGKTQFLLQTIKNQARLGTICIYAVIGQKQSNVSMLRTFFKENELDSSTIIVASTSSDPSGLIYLTPYTAMTVAEYFRDQGKDVLLILDDMTTHAKFYREISLLAKRFPGRSSYPGDIFYIHARLVERAGNFKNGSITCLPVAESVLGDLSGYIQTNLMAMTDGHIFFDIDLYNEGKRPAVSPFLSVTRVGHQTQTPLQKDVSRQLSSFLVNYERMKQFLHFGAEVGETAKNVLALGSKLDNVFNQGTQHTVPTNINTLILGGLWSGYWNDTKDEKLPGQVEQLILTYKTDPNYRKKVDELIAEKNTFSELVNYLRRNEEIISSNVSSG